MDDADGADGGRTGGLWRAGGREADVGQRRGGRADGGRMGGRADEQGV